MTTAQPIESAKTVWTAPHQGAALTAFKVTGVAVSSSLFVTLFVRIVVALAAGTVGALFWCCCLLGLATVILEPERHQRHHRDYSRGFCVTSGWMNPLLDGLRLFPRVELVVRFFQR